MASNGPADEITRTRAARDHADNAFRQAVIEAVRQGMPVGQAAALAGLTRPTIYRWMRTPTTDTN